MACLVYSAQSECEANYKLYTSEECVNAQVSVGQLI